MDALSKWIQTPEADKITETGRKKAQETFLAKYLNSDKIEFVAKSVFNKSHTATTYMYCKAVHGDLLHVFGSDHKYWSADLETEKALSLDKSAGGFPSLLTPSWAKSFPIPAVGFHEAAPSFK